LAIKANNNNENENFYSKSNINEDNNADLFDSDMSHGLEQAGY